MELQMLISFSFLIRFEQMTTHWKALDLYFHMEQVFSCYNVTIFSVISCTLTCFSSDCKKADLQESHTTWPKDSPFFMEEVRNQGLCERAWIQSVHIMREFTKPCL